MLADVDEVRMCVCIYIKDYIKNIQYKLMNYELKPVLLSLLQLKSESTGKIGKSQEYYIVLPLLADGSKRSKSYLKKELVFTSWLSLHQTLAGVAGDHVRAAGINPESVHKASAGQNRGLNLGRKQVSKT